MEKKVKISLGVTIGGVVILILGTILGWVVLPYVIDTMVKKESQLKNGTLIYEKWVDIPLPIYLRAYFFNVTNPEDFEGNDWSAKPIVQEVGPYVYLEKRVKYDIQSHPDRDTISFRQNITYTFVPELSIGEETDTLTFINGPLIALSTMISSVPAKDLPVPHQVITDLLLGPLFRERFLRPGVTIKDALFGLRLNAFYNLILWIVENLLMIKLPPEIQIKDGTSDYSYGIFINKNGTNADGLWEIYSGINDGKKLNQLRTINGEDEVIGPIGLPWDGDCNKVKGSDGFLYPAFMSKDDKLDVFATEICRTARAVFEMESEFEGISTYRYRASKDFFASPSLYPENQCYCVKPRPPLNGTCAPNGVFRLRSCKTGAPVIVSKPHFLGADQSVFDMVGGLTPDQEKHDTYLDVEPTLGVPLRGFRRLQISIETQPFEVYGPILKTISSTFFPYLWVEEGAELNEELLSEINSFYLTPLKIANAGKWTAVGVGTALTIVGGFCLGYFRWWNK